MGANSIPENYRITFQNGHFIVEAVRAVVAIAVQTVTVGGWLFGTVARGLAGLCLAFLRRGAKRQNGVRDARKAHFRLAALVVSFDAQRALHAHGVAIGKAQEFGPGAFRKRREPSTIARVAIFALMVAVQNGLPALEVRCSGARNSAPVMRTCAVWRCPFDQIEHGADMMPAGEPSASRRVTAARMAVGWRPGLQGETQRHCGVARGVGEIARSLRGMNEGLCKSPSGKRLTPIV